MKRLTMLATGIILTLAMVALAGCGNNANRPQDVDANNPLIGFWEWTLFDEYIYQFDADGTGRRGWVAFEDYEPEFQYFNWWTVGDDLLRMSLTGGYEAVQAEIEAEGYRMIMEEHWTFTISSDTLVLENRLEFGNIFSYVRTTAAALTRHQTTPQAGNNPPLPTPQEPPVSDSTQAEAGDLTGNWQWGADSSFVLEFNPDGTGSRNWNGNEGFDWHIDGDSLFVTLTSGYEDMQAYLASLGFAMILNEEWTFTIAGDNLMIVSVDEPDMAFAYVRAN